MLKLSASSVAIVNFLVHRSRSDHAVFKNTIIVEVLFCLVLGAGCVSWKGIKIFLFSIVCLQALKLWRGRILCSFVATCFGSSRTTSTGNVLLQKSQPRLQVLRLNGKFFPFELKFYFAAEHSFNWRHWYIFGLSDSSDIFFSFIVKPIFPLFQPKSDRTDFFLWSVVFVLIWGMFLFEDPR